MEHVLPSCTPPTLGRSGCLRVALVGSAAANFPRASPVGRVEGFLWGHTRECGSRPQGQQLDLKERRGDGPASVPRSTRRGLGALRSRCSEAGPPCVPACAAHSRVVASTGCECPFPMMCVCVFHSLFIFKLREKWQGQYGELRAHGQCWAGSPSACVFPVEDSPAAQRSDPALSACRVSVTASDQNVLQLLDFRVSMVCRAPSTCVECPFMLAWSPGSGAEGRGMQTAGCCPHCPRVTSPVS